MSELREKMLQELSGAFLAIKEEEINVFMDMILKANKIFTYACGREALMLKAFAMRLHHLGFTVHVVGDVTIPAIGPGDLFIVVCGPGYVSTNIALSNIAKEAGAEVVGITANKDGEIAKYCTHIVNIQAQTMSVKSDEVKSVQPMGAIFEQAQLLLEEYMVIRLAELKKSTESEMRARHTNLE